MSLKSTINNSDEVSVTSNEEVLDKQKLSEADLEPLTRRAFGTSFVDHTCQIGHDFDLIQSSVPGKGWWSRALRWIRKICYLDTTSSQSRDVFRSDTAMRRELSRQITFYSNTIHPFSYFRFVWECVMIFTYAIAFIIFPYDVTFLYDEDENAQLNKFHLLVLFIDFICLLDICCTIRTGYFYKQKQRVELSSAKIVNRYVRFWFWIDLISSAPYPLFAHYLDDPKLNHTIIECVHRREVHLGCFWDFWKMASVLKLLRLGTFLRYIDNVYWRYEIRRNVKKFTTVATIVAVSFHWTGCLMFMVPRCVQGTDVDQVDDQSWLAKFRLENLNSFQRYIECLFRTMYTLGKVTHKLETFMTTEDVVLIIFTTILGYLLKVYILAELLIFIRILFSSISLFHERRHELQNYINHEQMDPEMESRILAFFDFKVTRRFSRKSQIDVASSRQFHLNIREECVGPLLGSVSLFHDTLTPEAVRKVLMAMNYEMYLKDDIIVSASEGKEGSKMVFVVRGTVAVFTSSWKEVLHLEDNEHFGEYQLVLDDGFMKYPNIVAIEASQIYVLSRMAFQQVMIQFPTAFGAMLELAKERFDALSQLKKDVIEETIDETDTIRRTRSVFD
ncbi:potassium/sodium hyperpolarization-activated cyclic nucleotide-gated channel 4-like [Uranotaenia lowii]|uniref:potassium/sodium hyperpolarization-activated cyclic nucleotide-gated channel 4-like n=1 Tax=Uranotaenia lowii TaxID=190385 RepID=UPI00247A8A33|nr:potassium/sodium hyperpolarization-activated cyclic nucleotide-gated channel 4-like [Uranotaenia lowii]